MTAPSSGVIRWIRLIELFLRSRGIARALVLIAGTAFTLRAVRPWSVGSGMFPRLLPILLTVAAASIISTSTRSPIGELERTGPPLPALRLMHLSALLPLAVAALAVAQWGDVITTIRNCAGLTGITLLAAALIGAPASWIPAVSYAVLCGGAMDLQEESRWTWPTLPPTDASATLIAIGLAWAGIAVVTVGGARDDPTDST